MSINPVSNESAVRSNRRSAVIVGGDSPLDTVKAKAMRIELSGEELTPAVKQKLGGRSVVPLPPGAVPIFGLQGQGSQARKDGTISELEAALLKRRLQPRASDSSNTSVDPSLSLQSSRENTPPVIEDDVPPPPPEESWEQNLCEDDDVPPPPKANLAQLVHEDDDVPPPPPPKANLAQFVHEDDDIPPPPPPSRKKDFVIPSVVELSSESVKGVDMQANPLAVEAALEDLGNATLAILERRNTMMQNSSVAQEPLPPSRNRGPSMPLPPLPPLPTQKK